MGPDEKQCEDVLDGGTPPRSRSHRPLQDHEVNLPARVSCAQLYST